MRLVYQQAAEYRGVNVMLESRLPEDRFYVTWAEHWQYPYGAKVIAVYDTTGQELSPLQVPELFKYNAAPFIQF
jgi:hypothetical protein